MSEIHITEENVWQYYEKVSNYEVKCRFCKEKYIYLHIKSKFYSHLKLHIKILKYEEAYGRQEWPWIYFKYNNTFTSQCLLCGANFQSDFQSLAYHLHKKHLNEMENYVLHSWIWKYCIIIGDFKVKCNDCFSELCLPLSDSLRYHMIFKHSTELKNAQETHAIVLSSQSVWNLKVKEVQENVWKYYTKLSFNSFNAKCKFCFFQCSFTINTNSYANIHPFFKHGTVSHRAISEWEEMHKDLKWPWMYFKYSFEYISDKDIPYSECLMCGKFFPTSCESTINHILDEHSEKERHDFIDDWWIMKYFRESDDTTEIKCTICCKKITININPYLSNHTIEHHPEELQSNISKKDTQKLRQNYILENFQAKCQFCDFKSCYINITNFSEHLKKNHGEMYNPERADKHIRYPWKHFTYSNSNCSDYSNLQCRVCNDIVVVSTYRCYTYDECLLRRHLQSHNHQYVFNKSVNNIDWIWKYCTQSSDIEVQCNICRSKISLDVSLWHFKCHIEDKHFNRQFLTNSQRTCDITGPSRSQTN